MQLSRTAAGSALAATLVFIFVLCAIVQALVPSVQASHMWLDLFTAAPIGSPTAWIEGIVANAVFGFVGGYFFAWVYNTLASKK